MDETRGNVVLCVDNISKKYQSRTVVDHINLNLTTGVYGLLGANGAGKTTLMRMLCGILRPTEGQITLAQQPVTSESYRAMLGYLPQDFGYYPDFTGREFLLYMAALKGLPKPQARQKSKELLELVGLAEQAHKKIRTYSGGMKQRLGIAQALLGDPKLLILDEPTAGLDPKERVRFRDLIASAGKSSIVLLSTHIVSDVEHIADSILMMKDGKMIYQGKWEESRGDLEAFYLEQFGDESSQTDVRQEKGGRKE
ncbi:MAG: ABC transporter ATP-binding protein [Acetatifactor sp.]|nr:ABC transporter ATP-binding protein [Acetatifactor sp.]